MSEDTSKKWQQQQASGWPHREGQQALKVKQIVGDSRRTSSIVHISNITVTEINHGYQDGGEGSRQNQSGVQKKKNRKRLWWIILTYTFISKMNPVFQYWVCSHQEDFLSYIAEGTELLKSLWLEREDCLTVYRFFCKGGTKYTSSRISFSVYPGACNWFIVDNTSSRSLVFSVS